MKRLHLGSARLRTGRRALAVGAVAMLLLAVDVAPSHAAGRNTGGGAVIGTVAFGGDGLPPVGAPCEATSYSVQGSSTGFVLNTVLAAFLGTVTITGTGAGGCENATLGSGDLTLAVNGVGVTDPQNILSCPTLEGGYTRTVADVTVVVGGRCSINGHDAGRVSFVARLTFTPQGNGAGLTSRVQTAQFSGAFAVATV